MLSSHLGCLQHKSLTLACHDQNYAQYSMLLWCYAPVNGHFQLQLINRLYLFVSGKAGPSSQILYTKRAALSRQASPPSSPTTSSSSLSEGSPDEEPTQSRFTPTAPSSSQSQAAMRAREFAADLFRRAQGGAGGSEREGSQKPSEPLMVNAQQEEQDCPKAMQKETRTCSPQMLTSCQSSMQSSEQMSPASSSSLPSSPPTPSASQEVEPSEPGYVNYSCLHYCFGPGLLEQNTGGDTGE